MQASLLVQSALAGLSLFALFSVGDAQCAPTVFTPSGGTPNDDFGFSVDIDGTRAIVGAPLEAGGGAAYIYDWNSASSTWVEAARLTGTNAVFSPSQFGHSVGVSGDRAVVGDAFASIGPGNSQGSAFVFEKAGGTWSQVAELEVSTGYAAPYRANNNLGFSVAIDGDTIVAGMPGYTVASAGLGGALAVYKAPFVGLMSEFAILDRADLGFALTNNMGMGWSLAFEGTTIVAGAPTFTPSRVFVFELLLGDWNGGGVNKTILTNSDPEFDHFGKSLDLSGETIVVSALIHSGPGGADAGKVYVYEKPGAVWVSASETDAIDNPGTWTRFGSGVGIDEGPGVIVVGQSFARDSEGDGHVYQKVGGVWTKVQSLMLSTGARAELGASVAVCGDHKLLGATNLGLSGMVWDWNTPVVAATATFRNGAGSNPPGFVNVTPPSIGTSWDTTIDIATPGALLSILSIGLGGPTAGFNLSGTVSGELLILPPLPASLMDFSAGAHSIAIPADCTLIGGAVSTQGATFFPGDIRLQNAIDLVFGSY